MPKKLKKLPLTLTPFQLEPNVDKNMDVAVNELLKGTTPTEEFDKSVKACADLVVTQKTNVVESEKLVLVVSNQSFESLNPS